jgi:hypothetical protein
MLSEFVAVHRHEIVARCRARVAMRMAPRATEQELERGIPIFLGHLEKALASQLEAPAEATADAAAHGADLLTHGFTIGQVVHDYGDVCQTITALAIELAAPIPTADFRVLNRCLDDAIADAVTEYERGRERTLAAVDARRSNEQLGFLTHELRNLLGSAQLAFDVLRTGTVGVGGSTGDVLGRSLIRLRALVDRSLTEVRLNAGLTKPERVAVASFVEELEIAALLDARARGVRLVVSEVDPLLELHVDRQILASIISNLLQNAFKFTGPRTRVRLRSHASADRVLFEIEDQCGGIRPDKIERVFAPFERGGDDHSGLGLGLAICAQAVAALHGTLRVHNANQGCVFTVDVPRAPAGAR